ncbi:MAG: flavin-containing monooxygenase [Gemmatimonadaceae bacterium]
MSTKHPPAHHDILIVGAGFGGIGAAIRLMRDGIHDFAILERADDVGGVWRDNVYPGCACDVQSHLYSLSFAPNPDWTRAFSPQTEIWEYLRRLARDEGVVPHVRLDHGVREAAWDEAAGRWTVDTTRGRFTGRVLILAQGGLSDPVVPDLPGLARFEGRAFHSARWDHELDLAGKRVAVIGTGASAVQFVPAIQPRVAKLHVFQRTAPWVLHKPDRPIPALARRLYHLFPPLQRLMRGWIYASRESYLLFFRHPRLARVAESMGRRYLRKQVRDPALREKLTPRFTIFCKRILLSNDYYPALTRPNVEVVTDGIREVRERSVVTLDGTEREVDAIIFGTGFHVTDMPIAQHVRGRGGRTLAERWGGSPRAHLATTFVGFPNLFMLMGPNAGLGHTSVLYMLEAQIEHVLAALRHMRDTGADAVEPRPEAEAAWIEDVNRRMRGTVWVDGRCRSWYLDRTGRNSTLWPDFTWRFRRRVARFRPHEYEVALGEVEEQAAATFGA